MIDTSLLVNGIGFLLGSGVMWLAFQHKQNQNDHKRLEEALKKHAEEEGKAIEEIRDILKKMSQT